MIAKFLSYFLDPYFDPYSSFGKTFYSQEFFLSTYLETTLENWRIPILLSLVSTFDLSKTHTLTSYLLTNSCYKKVSILLCQLKMRYLLHSDLYTIILMCFILSSISMQKKLMFFLVLLANH